MDALSLALEGLPKALVYAAVLLAVGVSAARLLFLRRVVSTEDADAGRVFQSQLQAIAVWAAAGLVLGLAARAWGHTAVSVGLADSLAWSNLHLIAWESQWGGAWKIQVAVAAILLVVAWTTGHSPRFGWPLTTIATVAMCYALPLTGHAAGEPPRVLLHGSHVVGAGVWVGTLSAVALTGTRSLRQALLRAFAPFAMAGSALLVTTGLVAVWLYLGRATNLTHTIYGWLLLLKLVFVADVAACGFLNWRRFHLPSVTPGASAAHSPLIIERPRREDVFVMLEIAAAVVVVLVTAVLTEAEHP